MKQKNAIPLYAVGSLSIGIGLPLITNGFIVGTVAIILGFCSIVLAVYLYVKGDK